ncbi:MAG: glycoside hydrolase 5 family protein, partial [Armatimonadota bacterium]
KQGIIEVDRKHLLMAQRVCLIGKVPHNKNISFPVRHTSAFLDYYGYTFSPHETWSLFDLDDYRNNNDLFIRQGIGVLYNKTNKPVIFDEYGSSTYMPDFPYDEDHLEKKQVLHYRRMFETAERFGADGMLAWWWIGRRPMHDSDPEVSDWGILHHDGSKKPVFEEIKSWSKQMQSIPAYKPDTEIVLDDFAHADENDTYIEGKQLVLDAVKAGKHPKVVTPYTGSDSANCSLACLYGLRSHIQCPKRALNAAFGVIQVDTGSGFKSVEYGDTINFSPGKPIRFQISVANTAEALWLDEATAGTGKGCVAFTWDIGGSKGKVPISKSVESNTTTIIEFAVPAPDSNSADLVFRMTSLRRCDFGEIFKFRLSR